MSTDDLLRILPTVLVVGNLASVLVVLWRVQVFQVALTGIAATAILTVAIWYFASVPYAIGISEASIGCSAGNDDPGCVYYRELNTLYDLTLGNDAILWLLLTFDAACVVAGWFIIRRKRANIIVR